MTQAVHLPETQPQRAVPSVSAVLHGFTVGITADRRWDEQAALFERRRATVVHAPTIRTIPLGSDEPLRRATEAVVAARPDVVIAVTGLGIRSWFGAADSWGLGSELLATLARAKVFARGPKASGAMHSLGLEVAVKAPSERLAETMELAAADVRPGMVVVVQVDGSGAVPGLERLEAAGVTVIVVPVYEWRLPVDTAPAVRLAHGVIGGRIHAVTFTTGPALRNWFDIAREHDLDRELLDAVNDGGLVLGIVGPACADAGEQVGIRRERMAIPAAFRLGPLVRTVAEQLTAQVVQVELGATVVHLSGARLMIDDVPVDLSDTDARLFAALARRPGTVMTKADLLQEVWGEDARDEHLVEVAVARLRQRLGDRARSIRTVRRRGYRLDGIPRPVAAQAAPVHPSTPC